MDKFISFLNKLKTIENSNLIESIESGYNTIFESEEDNKLLIVMRGLPGSGKSTKAKKLQAELGGEIFSTDDYPGLYEYTDDGVIFNGGDKTESGLPLIVVAHQWNQERAIAAMNQGVSPIIVDNTNVQRWEAKPYVQAATENGYNIAVEEADSDWKFDVQELSGRNTHGVPVAGIQGMLDRWEKEGWDEEGILSSKAPWE